MNLLTIQDPFESAGEQHIDSFRVPGLNQAKKLWDKWRSTLNTRYVRVHENDQAAIRANTPPDIDPSDWQHLLERRMFTPQFQVS